MRRLGAGILLAQFGLALGAYPAFPQAAPQTAEEVAARLEQRMRAVQTLQADFEQRYYSVSLSAPLHEKGRLHFRRPDFMRWEYTDPEPKVFLYKDEVFEQYYPEDKQLIRSGLAKEQYEAEVLTLLAGQKSLKEDYLMILEPPEGALDDAKHKKGTSAAAAWRLRLTPRKEGEYATILLEIDRKTSLITRASFLDWAENRTEFQLTKIRVNQSLRAWVFSLEVPPDTEVIDEAGEPVKRGPQTPVPAPSNPPSPTP